MRFGFQAPALILLRTAIAAMSATAAFALSANASAYTFKTVHSFCSLNNCKDGVGPGGLLLDQSGNLYGVAEEAGPHHGHGVIFELVQGKKFKILYGFCAHNDCSDGKQPFAPLIEDTAGNLYGTTPSGGAHGLGVAFELSPNADRSVWTLQVLYNFCSQGGSGCTNGNGPSSGLTHAGAQTGVAYDGVSPLYGITLVGGSANKGTVFQLTPGQPGWFETVLYDFCSQGGAACTDGALPRGGLLVDPAGNLFGTTNEGGANHLSDGDSGAGTAFELISDGHIWTETVLYNFCAAANCKDGGAPAAALIQDASGNLYGTTSQGGRACTNPASVGATCGVIFKLVPNGTASQETVLYRFCRRDDCGDGAFPAASLLMDSSGNLFGTAYAGGGHDAEPDGMGGGVAFELSGSHLHVLHAFCAQGGSACTDGYEPLTNLVMDSSGNLFGTAFAGAGEGTVFKLTP